MKLRTHLLFLASTIVFSAAGLHAAVFIPTFADESGSAPVTVVDQWTNLSSVNHPTYPAGLPVGPTPPSQVWPAPIAADTASNPRGAFFQKQDLNSSETTDFLGDGTGSGPTQTLGGGIYVFTSTTHFEINSSSPVSNLSTLNLQISMALGSPANDVIDGPTLTLHTTVSDFVLTASRTLLGTQTVATSFGPASVELLSYDWDLSLVTGSVTGLAIDWAVQTHSISYGYQLTQGAVPEPSTWALLGFAGTGFILLIKRRRAALRL